MADLQRSHTHCIILTVAFGIKIAHATWPREGKFNTNVVEDDNTLIFTNNVGKIKYKLLFSTAVVEKLFTIAFVSV